MRSTPFLRTRTRDPQNSLLFQDHQNPRLSCVGKQNAPASMKGVEHEQATLRKSTVLQRASKVTRGIPERPGNLGRASCGDLSDSFEWKGSRRRTSAIASKVRASLLAIAAPRTQLLTLSVGGKN